MPLSPVLARELYTFQLVITVNQKDVSSCKDLTRPTPIIYTHFKITGLVRRFSGRRNMSSSRIHYCYIILTKE